MTSQVAPVLAMDEVRRPRRLGLFQRGFGEDMRDVSNQRDQVDRAFGVHRPQPLDDPRRGQAEAALAQYFQRDEFALSSSPLNPLGMKISRAPPFLSIGFYLVLRRSPARDRRRARARARSSTLTTRPRR